MAGLVLEAVEAWLRLATHKTQVLEYLVRMIIVPPASLLGTIESLP